MPAVTASVGFCIFDNDATVVWRMGNTRPRRVNILLYDSKEKWQIDQEISISRWFSITMHRNHHIVFMHLLYCAKAT